MFDDDSLSPEKGNTDAEDEAVSACVAPKGLAHLGVVGRVQDSDHTDHISKASGEFRRPFRVPHPFPLKLVELAKTKKWIWAGGMEASRGQGIPLELKVRTCLVSCCPHLAGSLRVTTCTFVKMCSTDSTCSRALREPLQTAQQYYLHHVHERCEVGEITNWTVQPGSLTHRGI